MTLGLGIFGFFGLVLGLIVYLLFLNDFEAKKDVDSEWLEKAERDNYDWWHYEVTRNNKRIASRAGFSSESWAISCGKSSFEKFKTKPSLKGGDWVLKIGGGFFGTRYNSEINL